MFHLILIVFAFILLVIYYVCARKFNYWEKKGIPYLKPLPILGNYGQYISLKTFNGEVAQSICQKFPKVPYIGTFYGTEPALLVQDPEVIKLILTKHFYYFNGREISSYSHKEVFTESLFFTYGDRWRVVRQNPTPLFSSAKMKNMFYLIEKCAYVFEDMIDFEISMDNVIELKNFLERYGIDVISSCAFGVDANAMGKDWENNAFKTVGHDLLLPSKLRGLLLMARSIWPAIFYGLGMKTFPINVDKFFHKVIVEVFKERNYKPTARQDFVDLLLSINNNNCIVGDSIEHYKGVDKKISLKTDDKFLVSECLLFFAAGFETSSGTLQFCLLELAKNQRAQEKVLQEVDEYLERHNNTLVYECVTEMPYATACIEEAMRLYPVLGLITREVMEDYTLPCGTVLDKGIRVHIPVYHMHHHPEYFPDPKEFRPERFYGEEKKNVVPYTYMPFGEGLRICIGMRFGKMQMMVGLITMLKKYRVELTDETPLNPKLDAITISTRSKVDLKLRFIEREGWQQRVLKKQF